MSSLTYEEYKVSSFDWLGKVPEHWQLRPLGSCFRQRREKVSDTDYPPLSVTKNGIVPQLEHAAKTDDNDNRKCVLAGDFVINSRSDRKGSSGMAPEDGSVSLINTVLQPDDVIDIRFAHYLLRSVNFQEEFYRFGKGIVADLWSTNYSAMKGIYLAIPTEDEQEAISSFLDVETSKIDGLVSEQRRLIELLKEKRQAVISHAVTKGLNPDAPMKPSGIQWLGDVPQHWRIMPVQRLAKEGNKTFTDGDWIERPYITDSGVRLLQTGNVGIGSFREKGFRYVSDETFDELKCTEVTPRDVLICRLDGPVGRACLAPDLGVRMITSVDNAILKVADDIVPEFIVAVFTSLQWLSWVEAICRVGGGFRLRISRSMLGNSRVPVPPYDEQLEMAKHMEAETEKFDSLEAEAKRAIELLQERRTALISAAVTGKIDVRYYQSGKSV